MSDCRHPRFRNLNSTVPVDVVRVKSYVNGLLNPRTYKGGGVDATPPKVFLSFFLEDKTSAPDVFSSCSFIPCAHFETSLVMVSCYGYEI